MNLKIILGVIVPIIVIISLIAVHNLNIEKAKRQIEKDTRDQIKSQIDSQYPDLPEAEKNKMIDSEMRQLKEKQTICSVFLTKNGCGAKQNCKWSGISCVDLYLDGSYSYNQPINAKLMVNGQASYSVPRSTSTKIGIENSNNLDIAKVEFYYINRGTADTLLGSYTNSSYSIIWDTSQKAVGEHSIYSIIEIKNGTKLRSDYRISIS